MKIEGTLWRVRWCIISPNVPCEPVITGDQRVSYLYDCPGRHSTNFGAWVNSAFCHFRFFNWDDRPYWYAVFVMDVMEVEL